MHVTCHVLRLIMPHLMILDDARCNVTWTRQKVALSEWVNSFTC